MKQLKQISVFLLILLPTLAFSQKVISDIEKDSMIERIKELIDSNYIFIDQIDYVNNSLDSLNSTGKYEDITDYKVFAMTLTKDLRGITNDKHFRVNYNPDFIKMILSGPKEEDEEEDLNWEKEQGLKENFGFKKIEILDGNIGYLKFDFFYPFELVKPTIDAAMGFVTNTDALIIDLTSNDGGYGTTDNYLGSFFFKEEQVFWSSSYDRPTGERVSDSTFQKIGGARYIDQPVVILVSKKTFSNGEKFAYCMKHLNKAKIIGQNTPGGANGIDFLIVNENFGVQIPVCQTIIPATNTNWEGVGVVPDIETSKNETFKIAYLNVLDSLVASTVDTEQIEKYNNIKAKINNR